MTESSRPNESGRASESTSRSSRHVLSFRLISSLAVAGLVAGTIAVTSQFNEKHMRSLLEREAETQLLLEARNLAMLSGDALLNDFPELTLVPLIKDIRKARPELGLVVVVDHEEQIKGDMDPRTVGQTFVLEADMQQLARRAYVRHGERLSSSPNMIVAETPVAHRSKGSLGRVVMALDRSFIDSKIHNARTRLLRFAAGLLFVAVLLTIGIISYLLRPIGALREGLRRIGRGDLDSPMSVTDRTELGALADSVNEMAVQLKTTRDLAQAREEEITATQREVITTLGDVVESRSSETANHTRRVGAMCRQLALIAGLDENAANLLRLASPMHDVGKIGIPDSILNKPGKLSDYEYKIMQTHTTIGYSILAKSERPILKAAAIVAHQHHEHWDGKGYPRKIAGNDIHIFGRITALVDVFDALASDRCYRAAMPLEDILTIINEGRGTHFDPTLVDLFLSNLNKFLAISEQYQDVAHPESEAQPVPSGSATAVVSEKTDESEVEPTEEPMTLLEAAPVLTAGPEADELVDAVMDVTS